MTFDLLSVLMIVLGGAGLAYLVGQISSLYKYAVPTMYVVINTHSQKTVSWVDPSWSEYKAIVDDPKNNFLFAEENSVKYTLSGLSVNKGLFEAVLQHREQAKESARKKAGLSYPTNKNYI